MRSLGSWSGSLENLAAAEGRRQKAEDDSDETPMDATVSQDSFFWSSRGNWNYYYGEMAAAQCAQHEF